MIILMFFILFQIAFNLIILTIISYRSSPSSNFSFLHNLGFYLTLYLMSQMITGTILGLYYIPNNLEVFEFIEYIISNVNVDLFTKYLYLNIAFAFFFLIYLFTVVLITRFLEVKIISRLIMNTRYKTFNFLLIMNESPLLFSILTLIGIYVYRVYIMEYTFNIDLFNLIEDLKNVSTVFDFNLYSNIGGELPSGSSHNNPFITGTSTSSNINMDASSENNPDTSSENNPDTSSASDASSSSGYATHSPTLSEADEGRDIRLMNRCRCCGLASEEHLRSNCPCERSPLGWKSHNAVREIFARFRNCCTCGTQEGRYKCDSCDCIFCSKPCSNNQAPSELFANSDSSPSDTEAPAGEKESENKSLKRNREDESIAELAKKKFKAS